MKVARVPGSKSRGGYSLFAPSECVKHRFQRAQRVARKRGGIGPSGRCLFKQKGIGAWQTIGRIHPPASSPMRCGRTTVVTGLALLVAGPVRAQIPGVTLDQAIRLAEQV